MQHVGDVVGPVHRVRHRHVQCPFQPFYHGFRHVFPLINIGAHFAGRGLADWRIARFNFVAVVVTEPGRARQPAVAFPLKADLFVDAGFRFQVVVTHHVTADAVTAGVATLAFAVEQVVRVGLVQARRFIRPRDTHFQREVITQTLRQVQGRAPVVANNGVMIETQRRGQHGAVGQLHVVFSKQGEDLRLRVRATIVAHAWDRAALLGL
ncbi:hypothetical protein D3C76_1131600 [compost metagenome]